jgi:predicted membrane-bound mannosyltransferase
MTVDIWMPMAVVAGVGAAFLHRRKREFAAAVIVALPPAFLCGYAVISQPDKLLSAALLSTFWLLAGGLAALCTLVLLRFKQARQRH